MANACWEIGGVFFLGFCQLLELRMVQNLFVFLFRRYALFLWILGLVAISRPLFKALLC